MRVARASCRAALVLLGAVSGIVLAAAPAWACPACVGKSQVLPPALKLVGLFLLVPFVLSAITMLVVRRLNKNV